VHHSNARPTHLQYVCDTPTEGNEPRTPCVDGISAAFREPRVTKHRAETVADAIGRCVKALQIDWSRGQVQRSGKKKVEGALLSVSSVCGHSDGRWSDTLPLAHRNTWTCSTQRPAACGAPPRAWQRVRLRAPPSYSCRPARLPTATVLSGHPRAGPAREPTHMTTGLGFHRRVHS